MKNRDIFFGCLFIVVFMIFATVMAGDFLRKRLDEKNINNQQEVGQEYITASGKAKESDYFQDTISDDFGGNQESSGEIKEYQKDVVGDNLTEEEQTADMVGYEYFSDALFIGDSRTVGLMEYGNVENADFFADTGMTVFDLEEKKIMVRDKEKVGLNEVLDSKEYGKIYLMLGINELGYRFERIQEKYKEVLAELRESQGNAIIYLCANLHVTEEQSKKDKIYNNDNINRVNEMIYSLADNETVFYIDVNELFDDDSGSLSAEYSSDAFHVYGKYYLKWMDWLCGKTVEE